MNLTLPSLTLLFSLSFFILLTVTPWVTDGRALHRRSIPHGWRDLLTDDVYNYHVNKPPRKNVKFEGDIVGVEKGTSASTLCALPSLRMTSYCHDPSHGPGSPLRNAIVDKSMRWERGIVPYEISQSFTGTERQIIEEALRDLMAKTCVRFVPFTNQRDYISFVRRGMGCSSYVARVGGRQLVDLQPGCIYQIGEVQHEVMHALGFYHEQSRTDRDQYVTIVWSNVIAGAEDQFNTYRTDNLGMPYDYESIMHYGWNYFAKDQTKPTILPKTKAALGSRAVVSRLDVEKINRLYECPGQQVAPTPGRPSATPGRPQTTRNPSHPKVTLHPPGHTPPPGHSLWEEFKHSVKDSVKGLLGKA
ncbi:hypothetical protein RvY_06004 [Ramazzottius varieornatus]|uniref:Metalloendopeptidase n=1 Tax=Ramazzottius varieornatus TaxID=947166 RepID=A0A1D1UWZ9_RAMVA|nr:hypothetical protein RvY_06004 [Ramazzottius varieornatus]